MRELSQVDSPSGLPPKAANQESWPSRDPKLIGRCGAPPQIRGREGTLNDGKYQGFRR
jgi:hypothetical protein